MSSRRTAVARDSSGRDAAPVIAIDGPGGAGKGTISRKVAAALGWHLLDSGALYRLVGLDASTEGVDLADAARVAELARSLDASFDPTAADGTVLLRGRDVTDAIRTESAGVAASRVAVLPEVRAALVERQRSFREPPGLVADGRDMGSVIFADSPLKIFLTASVEERALRRYKQLKDKGIDVSLSALSGEMAERDRRDAERSVAPLTACDDARMLDTTSMSIDEVVSAVLAWAAETFGVAGKE
ncbi:MAG: (d)CMP kinase [Gammaproteobacteria bacterium]